MLEDRSYMRQSSGDSQRSLSLLLIVVLVAVFVLQYALQFYTGFDLQEYCALSNAGLAKGKVWQLLTFQFLHSGPWPWHLLFNCIGLYFFGRGVEEILGSKRFLLLYFLSGIAGGVLQVLGTLLLPHHPDIPVVGPSAGVCGLLAIFCTLNPMQELTIWIYFFPLNVRARYFLFFLLGLSIFGTLIPFDQVAHAAHLGGILLGIAYVRWFYNSDRFASLWRLFRRPTTGMPVVTDRFPIGSPWQA